MANRSEKSPPRGHGPGGVGELWALAYPVIVATLSQSMMGVVDTFFMGRIGTTEQGAVGLAGVIFWTVISFFSGTLHGVSTFAAQHFGAGDLRRCGRDGWLGLTMALPSAAILGVVSVFTGSIFTVLGSDGALLPHASSYMSIRLLGTLFIFINFAVINFLRGVGDTRTPMYFTLGANLLNGALNYALVLGNWGAPRMGASGAALASVIATAVFSIFYLFFFFTGARARRFHTRVIQPASPREVFGFLRVGLPIGASWMLEMVSWSAFMSIVSRIGHAELAATNIVFQVLHFSFMGAVALGTAATTLVGQYLGAENVAIAEKTARSTIRSCIGYCVTMGLLFLAARYQIVTLFNPDPDVIAVGGRLFVYAAIFQFFDGLGISSNGVIRGAGDTRWPMILSVLLGWGFFIPSTYALVAAAGMGIDGAWTAATLFIMTFGIGLWLRQRSGKWKAMRV